MNQRSQVASRSERAAVSLAVRAPGLEAHGPQSGTRPQLEPDAPERSKQSLLLSTLQALESVPPVRFTALTGVLVVLIAVVDYLTGAEASFSVFYLVPVFLGAAVGTRAGALIVAGLAAVAWVGADIAGRARGYSNVLIPIWNLSARFLLLVLVTSLVAALRSSLSRERLDARTDPLSGLSNRRGFYERAELELAHMRRKPSPFTVAYLDLDDFKLVNDRHGHEAGDEVLRAVARVLVAGVRGMDLVARVGGDEFALLIPETAPGGARQLLERLQQRLDAAARHAGWPIGFSFGAVTLFEPVDTVEELMGQADALMYQGKSTSRNALVFETHGGWAPELVEHPA